MRLAFLATLVGTFATPACAGRISTDQHARLAVVRSVRFAPESGASSEIRNDCRLGEELIEGIGKGARRYLDVRLVGDHSGVPGRVLVMRFSRVEGPAGDEPGSKTVTLIGRLLEDGQVVASFTAQRSSEKTGETCELMGDIIDDLAGDVAEWLREPGTDAMLGEL
jgi:hypothetical protein